MAVILRFPEPTVVSINKARCFKRASDALEAGIQDILVEDAKLRRIARKFCPLPPLRTYDFLPSDTEPESAA